MDCFDSNNKIVYKHHPKLKGYVFPYLLDAQRLGGCPTLLVRRSVVKEIGGFDENLPRGNDGDFIRRIALKYKVDLVPEVLVNVFVDHGNPRIGNNDKIGLKNHINSQLIKLKKFENELKLFPKESRNILFDVAQNYSQLGNWLNAFTYYCKGLIKFPFSANSYHRLFNHLRKSI